MDTDADTNPGDTDNRHDTYDTDGTDNMDDTYNTDNADDADRENPPYPCDDTLFTLISFRANGVCGVVLGAANVESDTNK